MSHGSGFKNGKMGGYAGMQMGLMCWWEDGEMRRCADIQMCKWS
jgi:hypothetical protein